MSIRQLLPVDLAILFDFALAEGWVSTQIEFSSFLKNSPGGCFAYDDRGQVLGGIMTYRHTDTAWLGNFIVKPEYRGQGIGSGLLGRALKYLDAGGVETVYLCAAQKAVDLYERYGFTIISEIRRWIRQPMKMPDANNIAYLDNRPNPKYLFKLDAYCWGDRRPSLIGQLSFLRRHICVPGGYALYENSDMCLVGPWYANESSPEVGRLIMSKLLKINCRKTVVLDSVSLNKSANFLLDSFGFRPAAVNYLMFRGARPKIVFDKIFALASLGSKG